MNTRTVILPGALLLAAVLSVPAQAGISEVHGDTAVATVPLGDLDLTSSTGLSSARERVHNTARRLCHKLADASDLARAASFQACVDDAVTSAMQKLTPAANLLAQNPGMINKP